MEDYVGWKGGDIKSSYKIYPRGAGLPVRIYYRWAQFYETVLTADTERKQENVRYKVANESEKKEILVLRRQAIKLKVRS